MTREEKDAKIKVILDHLKEMADKNPKMTIHVRRKLEETLAERGEAVHNGTDKQHEGTQKDIDEIGE